MKIKIIIDGSIDIEEVSVSEVIEAIEEALADVLAKYNINLQTEEEETE